MLGEFICLFSFPLLCVPDRVTSAFGVFRVFCFKGCRYSVRVHRDLAFCGVEWAQKFIKNDTNDTKKSKHYQLSYKAIRGGLFESKDGNSGKPSLAWALGVLTTVYEINLTGQGLIDCGLMDGLAGLRPRANILRLDGEGVGGSGRRTVHCIGNAY